MDAQLNANDLTGIDVHCDRKDGVLHCKNFRKQFGMPRLGNLTPEDHKQLLQQLSDE